MHSKLYYRIYYKIVNFKELDDNDLNEIEKLNDLEKINLLKTYNKLISCMRENDLLD